MHENLFNTVPGEYGFCSRNCKCYEDVVLPFNVVQLWEIYYCAHERKFFYDIYFDDIDIWWYLFWSSTGM